MVVVASQISIKLGDALSRVGGVLRSLLLFLHIEPQSYQQPPNKPFHQLLDTMARTSTSSSTAKPTGVNRKETQKAARAKKRQLTSASTRRSSTGSNRRHSRQPLAEEADEEDDEDEVEEGTTQDIEDMEEDYVQLPRRPFVYLKAKKRRIPQEKITSEWKSLAEPSLEKIRGLLTNAKRSVATGARSKKAALMANQAVEALMGQLLSRLPRMPFPPKTNEKAFDLDKLLDQKVDDGLSEIFGHVLMGQASLGERNDCNHTFN